MLTGKQKDFTCTSTSFNTNFQVGKGGVNENMIKQIADTLEARELFKVSVLQNCEFDRRGWKNLQKVHVLKSFKHWKHNRFIQRIKRK